MIDSIGIRFNKTNLMMSNLSFDHPLSNIELCELQNLLCSNVSIAQIYFKDDIDMDSIEKVKLMLEGFPNVNDKMIEKYIMKDVENEARERILDMNFLNIDTWNIAYAKDKNKYSITTMVKYRKMDEWYKAILNEIEDDSLSLLDRVCYLYDKAKLLHYDDSQRYDRIPEIIYDERATSYGYNLIFKELLSLCGIPSVVENISINDENNYVTLVPIKDMHYEIDGIYVFDPSMDTIYKNQYKNNLARIMNYNFFGITLDKLEKIGSQSKHKGILSFLSCDNIDEFNYYLKIYKTRYGEDEILKLEQSFGMSLDDIYSKVSSNNEIPYDVILKVITKKMEKYPDVMIDKEFLSNTVSRNYLERNNELFNNNKNVKKKYKIDTFK